MNSVTAPFPAHPIPAAAGATSANGGRGSLPIDGSTAASGSFRLGGHHNGHHGGPEKIEKHFTPLVSQFLEYLKLEKHFSDYTVKSYGADLIQFAAFMAGDIGQPIGAT